MFSPSRYAVRRLASRPVRRWAHTSIPQQFQHLHSVSAEDLEHFSKIIPSSAILSTLSPTPPDPSELEIYNHDWMNKYRGQSTTVLKPRTTKEVSEIVKWCNERRIGIVPQGGNTGLVGGSVPIRDEIILSLSNMSNIRSFDEGSGALQFV